MIELPALLYLFVKGRAAHPFDPGGSQKMGSLYPGVAIFHVFGSEVLPSVCLGASAIVLEGASVRPPVHLFEGLGEVRVFRCRDPLDTFDYFGIIHLMHGRW